MNAQAIDFGSMHPINKIMSITTIAYKLITIIFMCTCMIYFYKTYKYNVGIFHMQKQLNEKLSFEENYNGATANIEFSEEHILSQSTIDNPKIIEEADFGKFIFNYIEKVIGVQNDTYIYNKETNLLVQIIPANNNIFQNFIIQLKYLYLPKSINQFDLVTGISTEIVQKEWNRRVQIWLVQQRIKKEKEEAMKQQMIIEENEKEIITNSLINKKDNNGNNYTNNNTIESYQDIP